MCVEIKKLKKRPRSTRVVEPQIDRGVSFDEFIQKRQEKKHVV
jgi:hypothetical protein